MQEKGKTEKFKKERSVEYLVPDMREMYLNGRDTAAIAEALGLAKETVTRYLKLDGCIKPRYEAPRGISREMIWETVAKLKPGQQVYHLVDVMDQGEITLSRKIRRKFELVRILPHGVLIRGDGYRMGMPFMITYADLIIENVLDDRNETR